MRVRHFPPVVVALLAGLSVSATGCDDSPPFTAMTSTALRAAELDPQHYVLDYPQATVDMAAPLPNHVGPVAPPPLPNLSAGRAAEMPVAVSEADSGGPLLPTINDDNVFVDHGDSLWTRVTTDAESTFALDVDTGSYRLARVFLDHGQRPDPASIRVEEWINAFDYGDRPSSAGLGLTIDSGRAPHTEDGTVLVRLGVTTPDLGGVRPPANVTFVIDTSGSMDIRDRLGMVQASLALLVQHLADSDTLAIVEYGSEARQLLAPTQVTDTERIIGVIDNLRSMGSTNMEAGLTLGYEAARRGATPGSLNVVVLASDGVANVGSTDSGILAKIAGEGDAGIHLVTVGFGMGNYNDDLMEQLADRGDGFYSYVNTFAEARRLFVDELTPTLTVAARDAKVQVRFDPTKVAEYRLIGYENRMLDDEQFDDPSVDAGELGAGHHVSALYEVKPAGERTDGPIGTVSLRWKAADGDELGSQVVPLTVTSASTQGSLRLAGAVAATAEVLRGHGVMVDRGVTLTMLIADVEQLVAEHIDGAVALLEVLRSAEVAAAAPTDVVDF